MPQDTQCLVFSITLAVTFQVRKVTFSYYGIY